MSKHGFFTKWIRLVIAAVDRHPHRHGDLADRRRCTRPRPPWCRRRRSRSTATRPVRTTSMPATGRALTPGGLPTTGLYYNKRNTDTATDPVACGSPDDAGQGGIKLEDGPVWPSGGPDAERQDRPRLGLLAAEKVDVNGTINDILYVGYLSLRRRQRHVADLALRRRR